MDIRHISCGQKPQESRYALPFFRNSKVLNIYNRGVNTIENLRAELSGAGVDAAKLDKQTLQRMLERVSGKEGFRVSIADIKTGRAGAAGEQFPMTGHPVE